MIISTTNKQIKELSVLIKKAKERKTKGVFIVEGTKMVAEAPKEWLCAIYVSESYEKNTENEKYNQYRLLFQVLQNIQLFQYIRSDLFVSGRL